MDSDKINLYKKIVSKQDNLIDSFDKWVRLVKANDLESASEVVKESNKLRTEIKELKKQLEKLNKKSGIILLN
jgi:flagellar hook-associated protein FlgK